MRFPAIISRLLPSSLLLILMFLLAQSCFAQQQVFTPAADSIPLLKSLLVRYEALHLQSLSRLPTQNRKDYEEAYKSRWEFLKEKFDDKEIYTSPEAQKYLDAVVAEIVKGNPALQSEGFRCYFSKSGIPNAFYIGEGVILFNMGLFDRLDNESQAAFVLCHEMSHFYLNHMDKSINKYVTTINSKEFQQELKNIKNTEYSKREQLEKLLKGLNFDFSRHSRYKESEADSMALVFMKNTRFDIRESLTTLALLDSIDNDTLKSEVILQKVFNSPGYPFKQKWINREEGLLGGHAKLEEDKKLADSLKTHPDCKQRIKLLQSMTAQYYTASTAKNIVDPVKFDALRNTFRYEIAEYTFVSDNYTRSLHYTLELLQKKPGDPYLVTQLGKIMNGFYSAQKEHKLSKYVDLPSPGYPENYNLLLQFVQNLHTDDYASLSYHFLKQYYPQLETYAPFKKVYNESIQIAQQ